MLKRYVERFPEIDVLAIQETKISSQEETERLVTRFLDQEFDVVVSHAVGCSAGCLLLLRKLDCFTPVFHETDNEGRLALLDVVSDNELWRFINIYAPNEEKDREEFFSTLRTTSAVAGTPYY